MGKRIKRYLRVFLNMGIFIAVAAAWFYMASSGGKTALSETGLKSLRYFTVLSNWLEGLVSLAFVIAFFVRKEKLQRICERLKYVAAVSVGLTFFTVVCYLGMVYGFRMMFAGANLWFHLIIPVIAMLEFVFFCREKIGWKWNFLAVVPMLLYGTYYMLNIVLGDLTKKPNPNDWYRFTTWGIPIGLVIFAGLIVLTFLIGLMLRGGNRLLKRIFPRL